MKLHTLPKAPRAPFAPTNSLNLNYLVFFHGGNTGLNPVGDANRINELNSDRGLVGALYQTTYQIRLPRTAKSETMHLSRTRPPHPHRN
jgi:hypothetical protein